MATVNASCCLFCATASSSNKLGKSKGTIKEQLEVIVILRDILGVEERKVNQFREKLHSGDGIQVCASCWEAVGRCVVAVQEIVKLQKEVASISASLKGYVHGSWMEEGDGSDSLWGQLRLEVLGLKESRSQEKTEDDTDNTEDSNSSASRAFDDAQNSSSGGNLEPSGAHDNDISVDFTEVEEATTAGDACEEEHLILNDALLEVDEKELMQTLNEESSSTIIPIINSTYSSVLPQKPLSLHQPESAKSPKELSVLELSGHRKARKRQDSATTDRESDGDESEAGDIGRPPQRYVCKTCHRSYSCVNNFKRHLKRNVCQRPNFQGMAKIPCKFCGHKFFSIAEHEKICRKRTARSPIPKKPCKYCGLLFPNRNLHEATCKKRVKSKPDNSWKQHLQLEGVNDTADVEMGVK